MFPIGGLDRAEHHERYGDSGAAHFAAERVGKSLQGLPRGDIGVGIWPDDIGGGRGDASDRAAIAGEHIGQEGAGEIEGRKIRHLDHGKRFLRRGLEQRQPAACAGIVDQNVGDADLARDRRARILDGLGVGEIDRKGGGGSAALSDRIGNGGEPRGIAGKQQHMRPRPAVALGKRFADAARSAGDQNKLRCHGSQCPPTLLTKSRQQSPLRD